MADARTAALDAALALQKANVQETEAAIENMRLYAPFDGTVVEKQAEIGDIITPSAFNSTLTRSAVVTLASLDQMDVETDVSENLLSRVTEGQPAEISVSAVPNKHYRGRLRQIIPKSDRTRGTVKVKVEILDTDDHLFPELVATVHFLPDKALHNPTAGKSFLFMPRSAVVEEDGHAFAWVVSPKNTAARRRIEVAPTNDELTRVESGLRPGEMVVLDPPKNLREGEAVKVAE
jgi:RND family efflux transporter MFP subunit